VSGGRNSSLDGARPFKRACGCFAWRFKIHEIKLLRYKTPFPCVSVCGFSLCAKLGIGKKWIALQTQSRFNVLSMFIKNILLDLCVHSLVTCDCFVAKILC
jgi:hypothetical protein